MARPQTRAQMLAEVRARLGESGTGFYTDAQINQWLNDGVDYIALAVEPIVTTMLEDATAVTGSAPYKDQSELTLPDSLISIKQVFFKDSAGKWSTLKETTYEDLFEQEPDWESDTADPPSRWYWRTDILGLYPKVKTTRTNAIRVLHSCRPEEMSADSSTTGLPSWLDRATILYAIYRCRLKDRDENKANHAIAELTMAIRQAGSKMNKHRKDHAPRIWPNQRAYRQYYGRLRSRWIAVSE